MTAHNCNNRLVPKKLCETHVGHTALGYKIVVGTTDLQREDILQALSKQHAPQTPTICSTRVAITRFSTRRCAPREGTTNCQEAAPSPWTTERTNGCHGSWKVWSCTFSCRAGIPSECARTLASGPGSISAVRSAQVVSLMLCENGTEPSCQ